MSQQKTAAPLSEVLQALQSGLIVPLADIVSCSLEAKDADLVSLECMLKQMRRRHLYDFAELREPEEREAAWKKAERCQAGLYALTNDGRYNTLQQYE
jgi:hypothetical protein